MSDFYILLGLDTLELIDVGYEKSPALNWGLLDHRGPVIDLALLGLGPEPMQVMLPADLLEQLYGRFADANPKGTVMVTDENYQQYAPPGLTEEDIERLVEEGELFPLITWDKTGYPLLVRYLPELLRPEVIRRLADDPELDPALLARAFAAGALPKTYGDRHWRWRPEWPAYAKAHGKDRSASS